MNSLKWPNMANHRVLVSLFNLRYKRLLLPIALFALLVSENTRAVTVETLADSFWAVSTYVAFTLAIYHWVSRWLDGAHALVSAYHRSRNLQVVIAALLGALPGCGGAIVVTTQFVSGKVGFGALVAVLTATMGDAAFLLLASQPVTGLYVIGIGVVTGCVTGLVINALHRDDFMRPTLTELSNKLRTSCCSATSAVSFKAINLQGLFWKYLLLPASLVAFASSFQIDINQVLSLPEMSIEWIGALLAVSCMLLWALTQEIEDYQSTVSEDDKIRTSHPMQKAAQDTNFVSAWVIIAFLAFELTLHFTGFEIGANWGNWGVWMPALGIVIGLLPGCGPQILVTSLYLSGALPFSAQLSNAISNDGDALFPAIALAPKAALMATLYSSIPAAIVGYGYFWLFEM
ncbi:putative manganese transporter [Vibrio cholerae]|uniref:putative manganese transporter n=1 Tax=Vibrio cholerae TaxID=666 RepID=UPI00161E4F04|nr:putative manganese transporter [Vibrio cholerae]EHY0935159.1 putative manganese transporter [Vibrio cholerae]EII3093822.1 putative manganese transporter [Vibrio cholerae]EJL6369723.1 putative manganese transporter [Vibrio cholerae]EJL6422538.1 putative manganese transporter [Vibrio cholerae]EJL6458800.1 putative manganese transporter [Vibrio cholerae]